MYPVSDPKPNGTLVQHDVANDDTTNQVPGTSAQSGNPSFSPTVSEPTAEMHMDTEDSSPYQGIDMDDDRESMLVGSNFFFDSCKVVAKDEKHED
jgi:hypothetical protein